MGSAQERIDRLGAWHKRHHREAELAKVVLTWPPETQERFAHWLAIPEHGPLRPWWFTSIR